jgi:hypothetical protein
MLRFVCSTCGVALRRVSPTQAVYVCPVAEKENTRDARGRLPASRLHPAITLHRFPRLFPQGQEGGIS